MERFEFSELCKTAKPISVEYYQYGEVTITFDNRISVEIDATTDWDSATLVFKSNIEKEKEEKEREERLKLNNDERLRKLKLKNKLKEILTEEGFEEIKDIIKDQLNSEQGVNVSDTSKAEKSSES